jgi:hypothetical protein
MLNFGQSAANILILISIGVQRVNGNRVYLKKFNYTLRYTLSLIEILKILKQDIYLK